MALPDDDAGALENQHFSLKNFKMKMK